MAQSLIGIKPLNKRLIVGIYDDGEKTINLGGKKFYLLDDTQVNSPTSRNPVEEKHAGIRPRWAVVLSVPDEVEEAGDIEVGAKVLLEFGEWTRGMNVDANGEDLKVWSIPADKVLGTSGKDAFSDDDREQISRLYPNWENWYPQAV